MESLLSTLTLTPQPTNSSEQRAQRLENTIKDLHSKQQERASDLVVLKNTLANTSSTGKGARAGLSGIIERMEYDFISHSFLIQEYEKRLRDVREECVSRGEDGTVTATALPQSTSPPPSNGAASLEKMEDSAKEPMQRIKTLYLPGKRKRTKTSPTDQKTKTHSPQNQPLSPAASDTEGGTKPVAATCKHAKGKKVVRFSVVRDEKHKAPWQNLKKKPDLALMK